MLWANVVLALALLMARYRLFHLPKWILFVFSAVAIVLAIVQEFAPRIVRSESLSLIGSRIINLILRDLYNTVDESVRVGVSLRCNLMVLNGDTLTKIADYPKSTVDSGQVAWTINQGCCGVAVQTGETHVLDLGSHQGLTYQELLKSGLNAYGMTAQQWAHTRDLGTVLSAPIFSVEDAPQVNGVLNFDARMPKSAWLDDTTYEQLLAQIMTIRSVLGLILMLQRLRYTE